VITARTSAHIRTSRNVRRLRSCPQGTGVSLATGDAVRLAREEEGLAAREARCLWLKEHWTRHFEAVAGPARVLPHSARSRQTKGT
jgi:hypothetical protein